MSTNHIAPIDLERHADTFRATSGPSPVVEQRPSFADVTGRNNIEMMARGGLLHAVGTATLQVPALAAADRRWPHADAAASDH